MGPELLNAYTMHFGALAPCRFDKYCSFVPTSIIQVENSGRDLRQPSSIFDLGIDVSRRGSYTCHEDMSRKLSRDIGELKVDILRKIKHDSKDRISKKDMEDNEFPDSEVQLINAMATNLGFDTTKLKGINADDLCKIQNTTTKSGKVKEDFLPVFLEGLTPQMQEKARVELGETEEKIRKGLAKLKASVEDGLPILEDNMLMAFLRVAKYDLKKAQDRMSRYYAYRLKMAKSIDNLGWETAFRVLRSCSIGILPYRDSEGKGIITTRGYNWYPETCDFEDWILTAFIICLQFLSIPANAVCGIKYLIDMQARDYAQVYMYFKYLKKYIVSLVNCLPVRPHIECVHENYICHCLYTFLKPHLPKKIVKRLRLHSYDYLSLQEQIDPCILPEEYGGTLGPLNFDDFAEQFEAFFIKFKEENRLFLKK